MKKTKPNRILHCIGFSFVFLMTSACDSIDTEKKPVHVSLLETQDSCVVSLVSNAGSNKSDRDIQKYQQRVLKNTNKVSQLENLGWAYVNKAKTSFDPGFYKLAEQTVACMKQYQPDSLSALLLQGHILNNLHQFKEAQLIARQLVKLRGYWFDYGLLGDALMEQGELASAIIAYQEMMDQNPGSHSYNRAANIRWLKGDVEGAIELLDISAKSSGGQNDASSAWALTRLAEFSFQSNQQKTSLNYLSVVLDRQPNYAPALLLLGRIKMAQGFGDIAVTSLTNALQLNPLPEYRWTLLEALSNSIEHQKIRTELENQLSKTGAIEDRRTYALYLATMGINTDKAVELAKQEIQLRHDVFTLDSLAWALRANHQLVEAKQYSKQALKEGTRSARLYYHAGVIANESGEMLEAERLLKLAKEMEISLLPSEKKHLNQFM